MRPVRSGKGIDSWRWGAAAASAVSQSSFPRSSRISASHLRADCDTTACSSRPQRRQAPPIDPRQPLLDFYALSGPQRRQRTARDRALNDNVEYEGGVVTWIDNLAGDRPTATTSSDAHRHPRVSSATLRAGRSSRRRRAGNGASHHRLPEAPGGKRRVQQSALAHLLSARAVLGLFRRAMRRLSPLPPAARSDRPEDTFRFIVPVLAMHDLITTNERFDRAGADGVAHSARCGELYARAALHRHPSRRRRPAWASRL